MHPRSLTALFQDPPASLGETYFEYLCQATGFGARMVLGGLRLPVPRALPLPICKDR